MITEEEFVRKVEELFDASKKDVVEQARRMYKSGAINTGGYENNYILPRCFMVVWLERMKEQWMPLGMRTKQLKSLIKNMRCF